MSVPTRPVDLEITGDEARLVPTEAELLQRRDHRWIDRWEPEDSQFWEAVGRRTARRNLVFSILTEHIGFSVWTIWSVMVLFTPGPSGASPSPTRSC